jgi:hypothetical protein
MEGFKPPESEIPKNPTEKPEDPPKKEIGGFEAWLGMMKVAVVVGHFLETKKDEIDSVFEKAKEDTNNPLLLGDVVLNSISKFKRIVDDYQVETEQKRADLQVDTINNLTQGEEELEELKKQRTRRETDLDAILRGEKRERSETSAGADDMSDVERITSAYSKIDFDKELSDEEKATVRAFSELAMRELKKSRTKTDRPKETSEKVSPDKKPEAQSKKETIKTQESKTFSAEFSRGKIRDLLVSNKNIKEVKNLEVRGVGGEINLDLKVSAGPLGSEVGVQAILESRGGNIRVKSHKIDAGWMIKGTVESILVPKLNEVSGLLKSYIEKEEKKKVEKMEIINGELVVKFK